jgi:KDO2-lipid IV(A) lauroyltransferase
LAERGPSALGAAPPPRLLVALARVVAALPPPVVAAFGITVGWLVGSVLRVRRRHVEMAMTRAGVPSPATAVRGMYTNLGRAFAELLWLAGQGPSAAARLVAWGPGSTEAFDAALAHGRGVVLAASHTGHWDAAACAVAARAPLLVVTKRLSMRGLDAFWQHVRRAAGVELAEARGALARARAALRDGAAVAMMIDQVPAHRQHAAVVPFLGADVWVDRAPFVLALAAGAPVVVAAARRDGDRHVLEALVTLEPPPPGSPGARRWVDDAARASSAALEAFVRRHPTEWLWMHRRWRVPPLRALPTRAPLAMPAQCTIPSSSPGAPSRAASS